MVVLWLSSAIVLISSVCSSATFECDVCECTSTDCNAIQADCSYKTTEVQWNTVPGSFSSNVEKLILVGQPLIVLEENVFQNANLTDLKVLNLHNCQIAEIHKNAFVNMSKLIELNGSQNKITHIKNGTFYWLKSLVHLDLQNNSIETLSFLQNLTNLQTLILNNNNINYVDKNLFVNKSKLVSLQLSRNKLKTLPDKLLSSLINLEYLHLSYNRLSRFSNKTFENNSKLHTLLLKNNTIELPKNLLDNLTNLTVLDLRNNKIKEIPENMFRNLINLKILYLNDNELETVPNNSLKNLTKHHLLNLSYNKINILNIGFLENNSCLENGYIIQLHLDHNNISSLIAGVFKKACVFFIDLSFNKISSVDSKAFADSYIVYLDLSHNHLSSLSSNTFTQMILNLDLSFNNISNLSTGIFDSVTEYLNLNNNSIKTISSDWFGKNKYEKLLIANNSITTFQLNGINFDHLDMSNNPINCDCKLKQQHEIYWKYTNIRCASPLPLKGRIWANLTSNQFACEPEIKSTYTDTNKIGCKVYGSPQPDIRWQKYNETIQKNDTTIIQSRTNLTEDVYWYNLTFLKNASDIAGEYSCEVSNVAGAINANFTVIQQVQQKVEIQSSTHGAALWTTGVLILIAVLVVIALYYKRRQRSTRGSSTNGNLLYDPLETDTDTTFHLNT